MASKKSGSAGSTHSSNSTGSSMSSKGTKISTASRTPGSRPTASTPGVAGLKLHPRPSAVLNPKTVDPFSSASKQKLGSFAALYSSGGIPCRLVHGSVKHKIAWSTPLDEVPYDSTLVSLAEGIQETVHPYSFVARTGFKELLEQPDAGLKAIPLLPRIAPALRAALSHKEGTVFEAGLQALVQLSAVAGPALNAHLKTVLVSISKRSLERQYKEKVNDTLAQLELNGGKEALQIIKAKIPTYISIHR